MKTFTQEQLEALKQYEPMLRTAHYNHYYRSTNTRILNEIKAIYDEAADTPYQGRWNCSHCVLKFLSTVGKKYFEDIEFLNNKAEEFVEVLDEVMADVPDEKPVEEPKPVKKTTTKKTTKKSTKKTTKK